MTLLLSNGGIVHREHELSTGTPRVLMMCGVRISDPTSVTDDIFLDDPSVHECKVCKLRAERQGM